MPNHLRCPHCGYSAEDAKLHGDHSLCGGVIPTADHTTDRAATLAAIRERRAADPLWPDGYNADVEWLWSEAELIPWFLAEVDWLERENTVLRNDVVAACERVAAQSALLSGRAEKPDATVERLRQERDNLEALIKTPGQLPANPLTEYWIKCLEDRDAAKAEVKHVEECLGFTQSERDRWRQRAEVAENGAAALRAALVHVKRHVSSEAVMDYIDEHLDTDAGARVLAVVEAAKAWLHAPKSLRDDEPDPDAVLCEAVAEMEGKP